ncbi:MAG: hydroxypyruvate isomerase [Polyangiaceae bacterium]|jgi:hydroxypyruvate isomerase
MLKFAANLTMLFGELDFLDRFEAAARAGFRGVEYLFPYPYELETLQDALRRHGLEQVLHNLPAGDWAAGERGVACHPDRVAEFQDGVARAIHYASALGCKQVNCLSGIAPKGVPESKVRDTFIANLKFAADKLAAAGVRLLIEPINTRDIPGFYLCHTSQAIEIMDAVASPNLWLQYDIYHMQVMEGDLAATMATNWSRIAHLQIADNPGRHEPGTGEVNYSFLFQFIEKLGYPGWIGCEYKPETTTVAGLRWAGPFLHPAHR